MSTVALPVSLDATSALEFAASISAHALEPKVIVDFTALRCFEPFGLLYAGAAIRAFFRERGGRGDGVHGVRAGEPAHEYLAHIGFFQWLGVQVGKSPGAVAGGATWLPVTTLTRAELDKRVAETGKQLGDVIQQECERLARVVTQSNQLKATAPVAYCLREVVRNVFEHAETDRCVLCAQKCEDGAIELAVLDQGRGIRRSLEEQFQFTGDAEALRHALRPGVSRSLSTDPDNPWGNSGFGLFVLSELGRGLGTFRVASGQAALRVAGNETSLEAASFRGTAIQLRLRRPKGVNLSNYVEAIIARGEVASTKGVIGKASKSTRSIM